MRKGPMTKFRRVWHLQFFGTLLLTPVLAQSPAEATQSKCKAGTAECLQSTAMESSGSNSSDQDDDAPSIQDNSFLIEEAYNQESGVVQHIQSFQRNWATGEWAHNFTQEWPVNAAPRTQLSYTIPVVRAGASPLSKAAIGDIALHYRYQLIGSGRAKIAMSPRFTVLLPTGDSALGHGAGGAGIQFNLPVSVVLTKRLVTHWNAGATFVPSAKGPSGMKAAATGVNLGQSFVWLAKPRFNMILETVFGSAETVVAPNTTERTNSLLLNPGVRWAYNFKNGLQIVPGVSIPVGVGPSRGEVGVLFYLSFEHPFGRTRK